MFIFYIICCIIISVIRMSWEYLIIAAVLIIILLVAFKVTRKDFDEEMNKLVHYLGGKDNIIDCQMNMSRFKVTLKDVTKADKDGIQKLGATCGLDLECVVRLIL